MPTTPSIAAIRRRLARASSRVLLALALVPAVGTTQPLGVRQCGDGWRHDHWCGWHFYEDPTPETPPSPPPPPPPPPKPEPRPAAPPAPKKEVPPAVPELQIMKEQQRRLEDLRHIAVVNPSFDNVRRYMEFEQFIYRQATTFSEVARRVGLALQPPSDDIAMRPGNSLGARVFDDQKRQVNAARLDSLKTTHALFYFFRADCPYCRAFTPTLVNFERDLGVQVLPISLDGKGLPEYPLFKTDNGIARTLNVTSVPALYLVEPAAGKVIALGSGVMAKQEILERISLAVDPDTERLAPGLITSLNER